MYPVSCAPNVLYSVVGRGCRNCQSGVHREWLGLGGTFLRKN